MDKHQKMRILHAELVELANKLDRYGTISGLFDMLHDNDNPWSRGVLLGMVRSKLETAELLVKSATFHLEYHLKEAGREAADGDGA